VASANGLCNTPAFSELMLETCFARIEPGTGARCVLGSSQHAHLRSDPTPVHDRVHRWRSPGTRPLRQACARCRHKATSAAAQCGHAGAPAGALHAAAAPAQPAPACRRRLAACGARVGMRGRAGAHRRGALRPRPAPPPPPRPAPAARPPARARRSPCCRAASPRSCRSPAPWRARPPPRSGRPAGRARRAAAAAAAGPRRPARARAPRAARRRHPRARQPAHGLCLAGARGRGERGLPAHAAACIHINALQRPSCGKTLPKG